MIIRAGAINRDHVHLLLSIPPHLSVSCAVQGAVAELVGIKVGVVSGVFNLESSGVEAVGLETTA